jgi:hypothetical protein
MYSPGTSAERTLQAQDRDVLHVIRGAPSPSGSRSDGSAPMITPPQL